MQIVQFVVILSYATLALAFSSSFSKKMLCLIGFESAFNLSLFLKFYAKSYNKRERTQAINNKMAVCGSYQIHNGTLDINENVVETKKED